MELDNNEIFLGFNDFLEKPRHVESLDDTNDMIDGNEIGLQNDEKVQNMWAILFVIRYR